MHLAPPRPGVLLNVAFSFDALALLRLPVAGIPPGLFRSGIWTADLQDPLDARGTPVGWKVGATAATTPHVLLILGADSTAGLDEAVSVIVDHTGPTSGFDKMYEDRGDRLERDIEHFGFRDGLSQPGVRGRRDAHPDSVVTRRYIPPDDPLSERFSRPGQPLIWPGQFIFGYPTQDALEGPGPIAVPPEPWMENGAFLVFRRLRQDVEAFERFARAEAARLTTAAGRTITEGTLKAWLVGRWPDGTPLVRGPVAPPPVPETDFALNHFDYADAAPGTSVLLDEGPSEVVPAAPGDDAARLCPHFAHVRKVNLRDKLTDQGPSANFRMLRRGIPYGQAGDDDRGLLFVAYMRDIQQFMTVSTTWMNNTAAPEGHGHDLLVGQTAGARTATRWFDDGTSVEIRAPAAQRWVIPTGGGFFFAPARSVLAALQP
jgi:Dyp-type peroxidase family